MKTLWMQAAMGAVALLVAGTAGAGVIDFENNLDYTLAPYAPLLADGDAVIQGNYYVNTQDINAGGGLIGQLSFGADPTSCLNAVCPSGNLTNFLSVFNDGIVHIGNLDNTKVTFGGLDAAYIATPGNPAGSTVYLAIEADRSDGSYASFYYPLLGSGAFQTITLATPGIRLGGTGGLTDGDVTDLFVYSYFCNSATGSCGAFRTNLGQFALDNIVLDAVTAVPEPSTALLALTGLAAFAAFRRRRAA